MSRTGDIAEKRREIINTVNILFTVIIKKLTPTQCPVPETLLRREIGPNNFFMKLLIMIVMVFFAATDHASADTIDHWHIYFNKNKVMEGNEMSFPKPFIIKQAELKETDTITIIYFCDAPCSDCITYLKSDDGTKARLIMAKGLGTSTPLGFRVKDLLQYHSSNYKGIIKLLMLEKRTEILRSRKVLEIKFE